MSTLDSLRLISGFDVAGVSAEGGVVGNLRRNLGMRLSPRLRLPDRSKEAPLRQVNRRYFLSMVFERFFHHIPAALFLSDMPDLELIRDIAAHLDLETCFPNGSTVLVPLDEGFLKEHGLESTNQARFGDRILVEACITRRTGSLFDVEIRIGRKIFYYYVYFDSLIEYGNIPSL